MLCNRGCLSTAPSVSMYSLSTAVKELLRQITQGSALTPFPKRPLYVCESSRVTSNWPSMLSQSINTEFTVCTIGSLAAVTLPNIYYEWYPHSPENYQAKQGHRHYHPTRWASRELRRPLTLEMNSICIGAGALSRSGNSSTVES